MHPTEELRSRGFRITTARKAILDILTKERKPLSASDICEALLKRKIKSDRVTVYRELEFLEKQDVIQVVQLQDRNRRYELASLEHHHHLICEKCEGVQDVHVDENIAAQERAIAKKAKFKVLRHSLEFFGLCQGCLKNA
jgi:Fe2+ or Zn2+ uptake regulation protein